LRGGLDGVDGTEDDTPFHNPGELVNVPGLAPQFVQQIQSLCNIRSFTFEVHVDVQVGQYKRRLNALLLRPDSRSVVVVSQYWD
jgi:hypothetical protein